MTFSVGTPLEPLVFFAFSRCWTYKITQKTNNQIVFHLSSKEVKQNNKQKRMRMRMRIVMLSVLKLITVSM
jgi:hypothetical protein